LIHVFYIGERAEPQAVARVMGRWMWIKWGLVTALMAAILAGPRPLAALLVPALVVAEREQFARLGWLSGRVRPRPAESGDD
jgi:hypothetical protein